MSRGLNITISRKNIIWNSDLEIKNSKREIVFWFLNASWIVSRDINKRDQTSWPSIKQNLCLISMFLNFMLRCINKRPFHHPCQCDVITISYFCYVFHIWTILLFMPTLAYRTTFHTISIFDIKYCGQPVGLPIHVQSHCKHCELTMSVCQMSLIAAIPPVTPWLLLAIYWVLLPDIYSGQALPPTC